MQLNRINIMTQKKIYKSNFLFPRTSMLHGIGSIFNVSGNYFEFDYSQSENEADYKAIENDWGVIGNDILSVINGMQERPSKFFPQSV